VSGGAGERGSGGAGERGRGAADSVFFRPLKTEFQKFSPKNVEMSKIVTDKNSLKKRVGTVRPGRLSGGRGCVFGWKWTQIWVFIFKT
jgi:hypothetical protein